MIGKRALEKFEADLKQVSELIRFDDLVLGLFLPALEKHDEKLANSAVGARLRPSGLIQNLKNIKSNESLKAHYRALYNQWLVLLVSYFSAAVRELFIEMVSEAIRTRRGAELMGESLKVPISELAESPDDLPTFLADLLASSESISFQDMGSIVRAFSKYFERELEKDAVVNDIILAQASRHVIVHSGGRVDRKMIGQLKAASPRTLKPRVTAGEQLQFSVEEIERTSSAMRTFLERLVALA